MLFLSNLIPCLWRRSKLTIVELAPESGSALMEKLVLWSSWDTVTRTFGVGLLFDDVIHTAMDVRFAGLGDLVLLLW